MTRTVDDLPSPTRNGVLSCSATSAAAWARILVLALATMAMFAGCGSGDRVATYPVTGEVVFPDGSPLRGGSILFNSQQHAKLTARGQIQTDGTFELRTYAPGDGAVAGPHQVAILPPRQQSDSDEVGFQSPIDTDFANPRRSGIVCQVKTEGPNHFRIEVKPPKQKRH